MNTRVKAFLEQRCIQHPALRTFAKRLLTSFQADLTPAERRRWPRWRLLDEISEQFLFMRDGSHYESQLYVIGLAPKRDGWVWNRGSDGVWAWRQEADSGESTQPNDKQ